MFFSEWFSWFFLGRGFLISGWFFFLGEVFPGASAFVPGFFPLAEGRLDGPIGFFFPDVFFEGDSVGVDVDFELQLVIFAEVGLDLVPADVFLFELVHQVVDVDAEVSQLVVLLPLVLDQPQDELRLPALDQRRHVEVQSAGSNGQGVQPRTALHELGVYWDPVFVEFLRP